MKEVCSVRLRKAQKGEGPRWKLLLWTAVASLIFGLIGAGELPEDMLRASRNQLHAHKASGDIVLVATISTRLVQRGRSSTSSSMAAAKLPTMPPWPTQSKKPETSPLPSAPGR
jgi:hypothetical protein